MNLFFEVTTNRFLLASEAGLLQFPPSFVGRLCQTPINGLQFKVTRRRKIRGNMATPSNVQPNPRARGSREYNSTSRE